MDTRRVSPAIRRRVGASPSMYDQIEPVDPGGSGVVGNANPHNMRGTRPAQREDFGGDRSGIVTSIPMSTDWKAIEDAFSTKSVVHKLWEQQVTGGGMD